MLAGMRATIPPNEVLVVLSCFTLNNLLCIQSVMVYLGDMSQ